MFFKDKISQLFCIFAMFLSLPFLKNSDDIVDAQQFNKGLEYFGTRMYSELSETNREKNIIFSPISIQTCITMARMGADGNTATEMDHGLYLPKQDPEYLAHNYHDILEPYQNSPILKIANKMYVMEGNEVQEKFNNFLMEQFYSSVDVINFANNEAAAREINNWVENKTDHLIKDLVSPNSLGPNTRLLLVNAVHLEGTWVNQFPKQSTREKDFYLDNTNTIKVQMMHTEAYFNYAEFPELDATALEMPYRDSDLSMLIFLPNSQNGLAKLEHKLQTIPLPHLTARMKSKKIIVDLPKFKTNFEVELSKPLKRMGMKLMFSDAADFSQMLKVPQTLKVSSVIHKAFIEVNEKGTEAAAATDIEVIYAGSFLPWFTTSFMVNKPFHYIIKNKMNVQIFKGSIKNKFK